jgi:O-antigen/teichoic acid export membrane protein
VPAGFQRIARATGWHMVGHVARLITGLLVGIYVARYLGPEAYGVLNYAISFALLFSALARLGLGDIIVRELVAHPDREAETLGSAFALQVASGTLALGLAAAAAWATQADATTRLMIVVIAGGVFFDAMSAPAEWFKSKVLARPVVLAGLIGTGVASVLRVVFVILGKPVIWFAWPALIEAVVTTALIVAFYRRYPSPPLASWRPYLERMGGLLAHSWPLALSGGLVVIRQRIDQVMIGEMLGPIEVGWYAVAARLSLLWHFVPFALATAAFPAIVRARETSGKLFEARMQMFFDLMLWLAVAIALPATLIAEPLVRFLYGDAYAPSALILQIHIWSLVFTSLGIAAGRWLIAEGLTRIVLSLSVMSVAGNILFNLILIPRYGAVGSAWATLVAASLVLIWRFSYGPTRPAAVMMLKALAAPLRAVMRLS